MPLSELGCRCSSVAELVFGATDISPMWSGLEVSKPNRYGDEISGTLAAKDVSRVAAVEKADGKKRMLEDANDLCSQSRECRDHSAIARVCANLNLSLRSGVRRSLLDIRELRVEHEA